MDIERYKELYLISTMKPQNPYWKEFLIDWGKKAIDRGSDSFFIDSQDGIFTFFWGEDEAVLILGKVKVLLNI